MPLLRGVTRTDRCFNFVGKFVMFALSTLLSLGAIVIPGIMIVDDVNLDARAWLLLAPLFVVGMMSTVPIGVALGSLMNTSLQAAPAPLACTLIMLASGRLACQP